MSKPRGSRDTTASTLVDKPSEELPPIPLNPYHHKIAIARTWTILFVGSCVLPVLLWFLLNYVAHLKTVIVLGITTGLFGVVSLPSLIYRTYSLVTPTSTCRPIGGTRWSLDYFHYNFMLGFAYITAASVYATTVAPPNPRVGALGLSLLLIQVCGQLVLFSILSLTNLKLPFRISSLESGTLIRPAIYTIIEDTVAVDGGQGTTFRLAFNERYLASPTIRELLRALNWYWGCTGLALGIALVALVFEIHNVDVAWTIGWTVPWAWAAVSSLITIFLTKAALKRERGITMNRSKSGQC